VLRATAIILSGEASNQQHLPEAVVGEMPLLVGIDVKKDEQEFGHAICLSETKEGLRKKVMRAQIPTEFAGRILARSTGILSLVTVSSLTQTGMRWNN
jgi:hypothetical protein